MENSLYFSKVKMEEDGNFSKHARTLNLYFKFKERGSNRPVYLYRRHGLGQCFFFPTFLVVVEENDLADVSFSVAFFLSGSKYNVIYQTASVVPGGRV